MSKLPSVAELPDLTKLSPRAWLSLGSKRGSGATRRAGVRLTALFVLGGLVMSCGGVAAQPATVSQTQCLSAKETRETVAQKLVVSPAAALRTARGSAGGGQALQARLCRREAGFIYQFAILRPDGKVVRLTLDAVTGKVLRRREGVAPRRGLKPASEQPAESGSSGKTGL